MSQSRVTDEPAMVFMLFSVCVGVLGWVIWWLYKDYILEFLRYFRLFELFIVNIFTLGKYSDLLKFLSPGWLGGPEDPNVAAFTVDKFMLATGVVGAYMRWPIALGLIFTGIYLLFFSKRGKFKKHHDLESLIRVQGKMWPILMPVVNFNPGKLSSRAHGEAIPEQLPLFAEALSPEEWLSFNNIALANGLPDREAVRKALIEQLGPRWAGPNSLPPYLRALYAAFALKGVQKRTESDDLLGEIALCWSEKSGFHMTIALAKKVDAIIDNPEIGGKAHAIGNQHAFRITALLGILRWARAMGGVLAPATFLWLRGVDRNSWYPLNNQGRRSFFAEAAGAMAHFMAEQMAKKPLVIPRVDTALITINQYLANNQVVVPPRVNGKKSQGRALV